LIIDILQQYGARKKLEHRYKTLRYAGERAGISVTSPPVYAKRFLQFMNDPDLKHIAGIKENTQFDEV
jgi:hypothetical protein